MFSNFKAGVKWQGVVVGVGITFVVAHLLYRRR